MDGMHNGWAVFKMVAGVILIGPFILIGRGIKALTRKVERKLRK